MTGTVRSLGRSTGLLRQLTKSTEPSFPKVLINIHGFASEPRLANVPVSRMRRELCL